ncbi:MAG: hypothetical protein EA420_19620 [Candidatus Competibacteraceae bacterium]|nr:MAG: hypothetical protein EA420_19620 [Candidatus Competibacteraceae bacterium]
MDEITRNVTALGFMVIITLAVIWAVIIIGAFLSFTHPKTPEFEDIIPMATGTVTQIIWPNNNAPGEVQDHATGELIPVPFSAIRAQKLKTSLPFNVGQVIGYDILIQPLGKTATNIRPLE